VATRLVFNLTPLIVRHTMEKLMVDSKIDYSFFELQTRKFLREASDLVLNNQKQEAVDKLDAALVELRLHEDGYQQCLISLGLTRLYLCTSNAPRKYYRLRVVKDIKESETEALIYGKEVHKSG